jgi:hypothetical protein
VEVKPVPAGKRTNSRNMHAQRKLFFEQGKAADANEETREDANCWLCHGRIDYTAAPGTTNDSHHLDHFHTVEDRPDLQEDPDNFRHAHRSCNLERGNNAPAPGLGEQVAQWW